MSQTFLNFFMIIGTPCSPLFNPSSSVYQLLYIISIIKVSQKTLLHLDLKFSVLVSC